MYWLAELRWYSQRRGSDTCIGRADSKERIFPTTQKGPYHRLHNSMPSYASEPEKAVVFIVAVL